MRRTYPSIERRTSLSPEAFQQYIAEGRPVVLAGSDVAWRQRWSLASLRDRYGDMVVDAEPTGSVFVGGRGTIRTSLREVAFRVEAGDRSLRWKGLDFDLNHDPPPTDALLPRSTTTWRRSLWLAPQGTMSSLHHDGDADNVNLQVSGRKRFVLIAPHFVRAVYLHGTAESPIDPFAPDLRRFPRFAEVDAVEAVLEPGDAVFVPKYWFHCVYATLPSVNVNTWFHWRGATSAWRSLAGAPLAHRLLTSASAAMKRRGLAAFAARLGHAYRKRAPAFEPQPRGLRA
jgi:hypothetical protein